MTDSKSFNLFFAAALVVIATIYCIGMRLSLMGVDATQYALISREMFTSGHFLQVFERGHDYLDKPPLLFWTACLSFKLFGVHDWAYRLPSVLCLCLGIYSVYRYAKLFYDERTGKLAALIMASCCASYLMTHDVRTDTMLTGWVMFSIWQLAEFNNSLKIKNILLGAAGIGMAMLTKGPIGLIIPLVAFSVHFVYKREWKSFFRGQYLVALVVIAIVLLPMSYGLYEQFDLHPEKTVYGLKGPSGLRFFYWTQSFGRITGESAWNNNPDPFFLEHSFLWSFIPWTVFFLAGFYEEIKSKIQSLKKHTDPEAVSIGGFLIILIFLSLSKYQLPHYTFAIHPLAAVIAAKYVNRFLLPENRPKFSSVVVGTHIFVMLVMYTLAFVLVDFVFPASALYTVFISVSLLIFLYIWFSKKIERTFKILGLALIPFITLTAILNLHFYPHLLKYQTGSEITKDVDKIAPDNSRILMYKSFADNPTIFYSHFDVFPDVGDSELNGYLIKGHTYILADSANIKAIQKDNPAISVVKIYDDYPVTQLNTTFLNPSKRNTLISKRVLMKY